MFFFCNPVEVTDKTFVMPASAVTVTVTFEELPIASVAITWGSLEFTYDDTIDERNGKEKGWTCELYANVVAIENTGEADLVVVCTYTPYEGYESIEGVFTPFPVMSPGDYGDYKLDLYGKPEKALNGEKIGKVTITISRYEGESEY